MRWEDNIQMDVRIMHGLQEKNRKTTNVILDGKVSVRSSLLDLRKVFDTNLHWNLCDGYGTLPKAEIN
jgi:hypothetical protein